MIFEFVIPIMSEVSKKMPYRLENFHTHLPYCGHADGDAIDYVRMAEDAGFVALGFSDHSPVSESMRRDGIGFKMHESEISAYRSEVLAVKQQTSIPIYLGMEIDIISQEYDYLQNVIIPQLQPDYLIGSIHYVRLEDHKYADLVHISDAQRLDRYFEELRWAIQQPEFLFIGHPDRVVYNEYVQQNSKALTDIWLELAKLAKKMNKPLEYNTSAPSFLSESLWQSVVELGTPVVVSSDAHHPSKITYGLKEAYDWLEKHQANIVYASELIQGK